MSSIYNIGVSALRSAQIGLEVTGHNIANANTPGFSRQEAVQSSLYIPGEITGKGVQTETIIRHYDKLLSSQINETTSKNAYFTNTSEVLQKIDMLFSSENPQKALNDFFSSMQTLASDSSSMQSRQNTVQTLNDFKNTFSSLHQNIQTEMAVNTSQKQSILLETNQKLKELATVNKTIETLNLQEGTGNGNDLLDQRDLLLQEISANISINFYEHPNKTVDVFSKTGETLVLNAKANELPNKEFFTNPGGKLGASIEINDILETLSRKMGVFLHQAGDTINEQQKRGMTLDGTPGQAIFNIDPVAVSSATANTGNAVLGVSIESSANLKPIPYNVFFDGANYQLQNSKTKETIQTFTPVALQTGVSVDGLFLQITPGATPTSAGDQYTFSPADTIFSQPTGWMKNINSSSIAADNPLQTKSSLSNIGDGGLSSVKITDPSNLNLLAPISFIVGANSNTVLISGTGIPANTTAPIPSSISFNGWEVSITSGGAPNDQYSLTYSPLSRNGENANLMSQAGNNSIPGFGTIQNWGEVMMSEIGGMAQNHQSSQKTYNNLNTSLYQQQQSVSGVNLEEEAVNLLKYRHAYEAAAKVIQISDDMFKSLLAIGA